MDCLFELHRRIVEVRFALFSCGAVHFLLSENLLSILAGSIHPEPAGDKKAPDLGALFQFGHVAHSFPYRIIGVETPCSSVGTTFMV